jgi:cyclophilin family peptidyl-prolyl cis-trans isomerase
MKTRIKTVVHAARNPVFVWVAAVLVFGLPMGSSLWAGDFPTVKLPLPDLVAWQGTSVPAIDLQGHFEITGIHGQVVQFRSVLGAFNLEMLPVAAPQTVTNFLRYANAGRYVNNVVHRSDTSLGVIQGGEFTVSSTNMAYIGTYPPIPLEYHLPNVRGSIAMARGSAPNSASCQWFINTKDNTITLGQANGGGYAVFGRVTGTGMTVVDAIAALPTYVWGAYQTWPMVNYAGGTAAVYYTNLIAMNTAQVVPLFPAQANQLAVVTFSVTNSNPALANVTLSGSLLNIAPVIGQNGQAIVTVTATDSNGHAAQDSFQLVVTNINSVTLTVAVQGLGSVSKVPDQPAYSPGAVVTLTATPASNHVFTGWSGDAGGIQNPLLLELSTNKLVTASFQFASPRIIEQPTSIIARQGAAAGFQVSATGGLPLYYQWRKAGSPISAATASNLGFAAVSELDAGRYDVVVENAVGAVTSEVASLRVTIPGRITNFTLQPDGTVALEGTGATNRQLMFSTSSNLLYWSPWMLLPNPSGSVQVLDPAALAPRKFYRVESW